MNLSGYFTLMGLLMVFPFSLGGISANYLYFLLPFLQAATNSFSLIVFKLSSYSKAILFVFSFNFICGLLLYFLFPKYHLESFFFGAFIFFATYIFPTLLRVSPKVLEGLVFGILLFSIVYSLFSACQYLLGGVYSAEAKDLVGTQRIGFVLNFSFFLVLANVLLPVNSGDQTIDRPNVILSIFTVVTLLIGSVLTFSRSSIISMIVTLLFLLLREIRLSIKSKFKFSWKNILLFLFPGFLALFAISSKAIGYLFSFYGTYLFEGYLANPEAIADDLGNPQASGGTRIAIQSFSFKLLLSNPIIGNSFRGLSEISEWGSLHNQYLDILVRSGLLLGGFVLLLQLVMFLRFFKSPVGSKNRTLLYPFVSTLIYGFFHETFRESQGAFLYFIYVQHYFLYSGKSDISTA